MPPVRSSTASFVAFLCLLLATAPLVAPLRAAPQAQWHLTASEIAELRREARDELLRAGQAATTGPASTEAAWQRVDAEPDPLRREALLDAWLRDWVLTPLASKAASERHVKIPVERLEELTRHPAVATTTHHEHPRQSMSVFGVASLARNAILSQRVHATAAAMQRDRSALGVGLARPRTSTEFRAAVRALADPTLPDRDSILAELRQRLPSEPWLGKALLELTRLGVADPDTLLDLVQHADRSSANAAIRLGDRFESDLRRQVIDTALLRPDLAGLAIARVLPSGSAIPVGDDPSVASHADHAPQVEATVEERFEAHAGQQSEQHSEQQRLWQLLGDRAHGADAALALARSDLPLVQRIDASFDQASSVERLRMLLVLKLRDTPPSRALLEALRAAHRLTPAERNATEAWR